MNIIDRVKIVAAIAALCVLSVVLVGEPPKYEKGTMIESAEHKAWVKKQKRDEL